MNTIAYRLVNQHFWRTQVIACAALAVLLSSPALASVTATVDRNTDIGELIFKVKSMDDVEIEQDYHDHPSIDDPELENDPGAEIGEKALHFHCGGLSMD